ncbi:hypothetical protein V5799_009007 [Amblyomma americanum]|uniref:Secreted protein n=1 Tax=Amblyomma americanum TaxID=6943 RepID=A0AAQ4FD76_AMBAM
MASYEIVLFLLSLLVGMVLRRAVPVAELSVVEQLERKLNSLENQKRKLKRQLADFKARASKSEARLLEDTSATREGQAQQEPDYGFDRILDLVRLRLSSPVSRSDNVADFEYLRCTSNLSPASTLCGSGGAGGGPATATSCFGTVRKSGYLRLARTLHKRMPEVSEERLVACLETLRSQNGGLTGLRISEIREEVSRLIQDWPPSPVR